jgi:hypothetical protein
VRYVQHCDSYKRLETTISWITHQENNIQAMIQATWHHNYFRSWSLAVIGRFVSIFCAWVGNITQHIRLIAIVKTQFIYYNAAVNRKIRHQVMTRSWRIFTRSSDLVWPGVAPPLNKNANNFEMQVRFSRNLICSTRVKVAKFQK